MYCEITKDHLTPDPDDEFCRTGLSWGDNDGQRTYTGKLYDDDGELYYTISYDREAFLNDDHPNGLYNLYNWCMNDSGCTDLKVKLADSIELTPSVADINRRLARNGWVSVYG